jgi:hypothetical protein
VSGKIFHALEWPSTVANCCFTGCAVVKNAISNPWIWFLISNGPCPLLARSKYLN